MTEKRPREKAKNCIKNQFKHIMVFEKFQNFTNREKFELKKANFRLFFVKSFVCKNFPRAKKIGQTLRGNKIFF